MNHEDSKSPRMDADPTEVSVFYDEEAFCQSGLGGQIEWIVVGVDGCECA
jgi:hypothetical protein